MFLGGPRHYRAIWKIVLIIGIFGALVWTVFDIISFSPTLQITTYVYDNSCLYHPLSPSYRLWLQPKTIEFPLKELELNDYGKLMDLNDFTFSINQPKECLNSSVLLLVLVTTAVQNFNRRMAIRSTWGQKQSKIKVLFMLGTVRNDTLQGSVQLEHQKYGDIIQGNFIDSYRNLTYKTMMTLKYVVYHCSNAHYIFKTDDDVFVNMPLMKNYLTNDLSPFGAQNLLQCIVLRNRDPIRTNSKWIVTEEEFPASKFPDYCNGAWALLSPDVLFKLYKEAQKTKFFYLEDIFLYGIAGGKVKGLVHEDIRNLTLSYMSPYPLDEGAYDNINFLIGTFGMDESHIKNFWNYVMNRPVKSSVYDYNEFSSL